MGPASVKTLRTIIDDLTVRHALDAERVRRALKLAEEIYRNREHWSGESMSDHVTGVLQRLLPFEPDEDAIIACVLQHVLLSGTYTLLELEEQFGAKVRHLVSGIHLLSHVTLSERRSTIEDLRLMLLTVSDDIRTVLITLCDRSYLLSRVKQLLPDVARHLSQDVLHLFAPVAARLGIYTLKHELEDRAFPILYPSDAERVAEQVETMHLKHGDFLDDARAHTQAYLTQHGVPCVVEARQKHHYSIFSKMSQKSLTHVQDIYDFYALRVVVHSIPECYQALGLLHTMARAVPHRFKDYISFPKPNGYQSLHTTLRQVPGAPEEVPLEVQVRTEEMQREASFGIAAHWSYKTHGSTRFAMEQAQLHRMIASQEALEHGDNVRLSDQIYVLTPRGDVIELPEGATPLDFAFRLHTDLGLSFRGARVNGSMVPINHQLENGDVIEILKHSSPRPSPEWLQLLRMSSARSKLKRYIFAQERPMLVARGRDLLNEQLRRFRLPPLDQDLSVLRRCDDRVLTVQQREDILAKIGQGAERAITLLTRADALRKILPPAFSPEVSLPPRLFPTEEARTVILSDGVPMPTRYAKCCKPEEEAAEEITGVISRTGMVVIHRQSCRMLRNSNPARRVQARWR